MAQQELLDLLRSIAAQITEKLTADIAFLQATAQENPEPSTSDWIQGFDTGRRSAFAQAAQWQQETLDELRLLLEPD